MKMWSGRFRRPLNPEFEQWQRSFPFDQKLLLYELRRLVDLAGDVGLKLHAGRSRNEQIATDLRLFVRDAIDQLGMKLVEFVDAILDKAKAAGQSAMPAHTHLQAAEPVLVAHWLLTYAEMLLRDHSRLQDCRERLNFCPLGSGAVAGATLPLDRQAMAAELGFTGPTANSIDATSDRDFAIEFVQSASLLGIHLSRWGAPSHATHLACW